MKLPPLPKIEMHTFYLAGAILMCVSVLGNIWNAYSIWGILTNFGAKLSTITGVLFNLLWVGLFVFLYKMTPRQPQISVINDPEMDRMLRELKQEDSKSIRRSK